MKNHIRKTLPENKQTIMTYQSKELSTKFNVKVKAELCYQNNLVYHGKCPYQTCTGDYIRETEFRIKERIIDHNKRGKNSHILKHSREKGHKFTVTYEAKISKYWVIIIVQLSNGRLVKFYS